MQGWDTKELLYYGRHEKKPIEELGVKFEPNFDAFLGKCDVVSGTQQPNNNFFLQPPLEWRSSTMLLPAINQQAGCS